MILIIIEEKDITTKKVIDWLLSFKAPFRIQNTKTNNILNSFIINDSNIAIKIDNQNYDDINKIWHSGER